MVAVMKDNAEVVRLRTGICGSMVTITNMPITFFRASGVVPWSNLRRALSQAKGGFSLPISST